MRSMLRQGLIAEVQRAGRAPAIREQVVRAVLLRVLRAIHGESPEAAQLALAAALIDVSKSIPGDSLEQMQTLIADLWAAASKEGT